MHTASDQTLEVGEIGARNVGSKARLPRRRETEGIGHISVHMTMSSP